MHRSLPPLCTAGRAFLCTAAFRPSALQVVLSGIFPEVGGGKGLSLGKEKVTAMVEAFGGVVTYV